jgi:hypothetical protein
VITNASRGHSTSSTGVRLSMSAASLEHAVMSTRSFCRANLARIDPLFQGRVTNSGQTRRVEWFQKVAHDRLAFTLDAAVPHVNVGITQLQNSNFTPNCITRGSPAEGADGLLAFLQAFEDRAPGLGAQNEKHGALRVIELALVLSPAGCIRQAAPVQARGTEFVVYITLKTCNP